MITSLIASLALLQPAPTPCATEEYHQFDFWVGHWDVYDTDNNLVGENIIEKQENDCLIVEHWTSAQGGTGQSYNYYDPVTEKWRQVWVSGGSVIDYEGGLDDSGAMALKGEIHYRTGTSFPFTGSWSLNEDGSVTQDFKQFNPETEEWDGWFTGNYRRKPE